MRNFILCFTLFAALCCCSAMARETIYYPKQETNYKNADYPIEVLRLALERSDVEHDYSLESSSIVVLQERVLKLVEQNAVIDVAWSITNKSREEQLRAIKFPIYKGLYGLRVALVKRENRRLLSSDNSLEHIKKNLIAIQGHDWPDLQVLKHNGFNVDSVASYDGLFNMLAKGRVDYFPRSILEAWKEVDYFSDLDLLVDEHLLFYYPAVMYYFVNKDNEKLAKTLESGLNKAKQDGSFDLLFDAVHRDYLKLANVNQRTILKLENPLINVIEEEDILDPSELE